MRSYNVALASLAIDAPIRWTDNLISNHSIAGVTARQRGVTRHITHRALLILATVRELHVVLGMGVRDAVQLADALLAGDAGTVPSGGHLCVTLDQRSLEFDVERRLRAALESAPSIRRGRPPGRTRGGTVG